MSLLSYVSKKKSAEWSCLQSERLQYIKGIINDYQAPVSSYMACVIAYRKSKITELLSH